MFKNAKKVPAVATAQGKGKAAAKAAELLPGLAEVAALEACEKALKGMIETKKAALKDAAREVLIERGLDRHSRPDTMHLAEGDFATGTAFVAKRGTRSPLTPDEVEQLADLLPADSIKLDEDNNVIAIDGFCETVESGPSYLAVNEAYMHDEAMLTRIDNALRRVKGIPEDFIVQTTPPSKIVASDTATDAVFRLDPDVAKDVFPLIAGVTLTTVFRDMLEAWQAVKPLFTPADAKAAVRTMLRAAAAAE